MMKGTFIGMANATAPACQFFITSVVNILLDMFVICISVDSLLLL